MIPEPVVIGASFDGKAIILHLQLPSGNVKPLTVPTVHQGAPVACMAVLVEEEEMGVVFVYKHPEQKWNASETLFWPILAAEVRRDLDRAWSDLLALKTPEQAAV